MRADGVIKAIDVGEKAMLKGSAGASGGFLTFEKPEEAVASVDLQDTAQCVRIHCEFMDSAFRNDRVS